MANRKLNSIKFPDIADTYILDADKVNYDDSETYASGSVGKGLNDLKSEISDVQNTDIFGKILLVQDDENPKLHKAFAKYRSSLVPACFVTGYQFTDRLRVGFYFYSPYPNSTRQVLISSSTQYNPATDGELTVDNADVKSPIGNLTTNEMYYHGVNKSGAIANTTWYERPVLYIDEKPYYGDMWKFDIDANNVITATHIDSTIGEKNVITNAFYASSQMRKWLISCEKSRFDEYATFYSLLVNSGVINSTSETREDEYAPINEDDFTGNRTGLSLCYQTGDGLIHIVDTVCPVDSVDGLPTIPSTAGSYKLVVTVADGSDPVLSWESEV